MHEIWDELFRCTDFPRFEFRRMFIRALHFINAIWNLIAYSWKMCRNLKVKTFLLTNVYNHNYKKSTWRPNSLVCCTALYLTLKNKFYKSVKSSNSQNICWKFQRYSLRSYSHNLNLQFVYICMSLLVFI